MAKPIKVQVDLDFTAKNLDKEAINQQINTAIEAVKINLDPQSAKKFEAELKELGSVLQRHLNESTGKINPKGLVADLNNRETFAAIDELGNRYSSVGINAKESFRKVAEESSFLNKSLRDTNSWLDKMGTTLTNTIRWNISASVVNSFAGAIQKTYYYAKDLDRVLNDIRIVTGHSKDRMEEFSIAANKAAKELKVSTIDYAEAATLFYQQGFNDSDVENMTRAAVMASKITGTSTEEMSNLLTSTLNGYKMATDQILDITDKFAAIGATTASSFDEIAIATSKVASMGKTAGVTIDELSAQLATITSVTRQAPESVGTSLKTIYGRMLAFKTNTKTMMEDEDGEMFGAPAVEKALEAYSRVTGEQISLFKTTADGKKVLRDLGEVINDIGNSWEKTDDKQAKFALTTAIAGARQQNNLVALFEAWEMYQDAVVTSLNAEGTTLEQNAIYLDSYEGKIAGLQASKESLYSSLTDSDSMKSFIGGLTIAVDLTTKLVDAAGGLFGAASMALGLMGDGIARYFMNSYDSIADFMSILKLSNNSIEEQSRIMSDLTHISAAYGSQRAEDLRTELVGTIKTTQKLNERKERLLEERALMNTLSEIYDKNTSAAKRELQAKVELDAVAERGTSIKQAQLLLETHEELLLAKQRLNDLETQNIGEGASQAINSAVKVAKNEVQALEEQITHIKSMTDEAIVVANFKEKESRRALEEQQQNLSDMSEKAQKAEVGMAALRTALVSMPAAFKSASDGGNSFMNVLGSIGKSLLPLVTFGVVKLGKAFVNTGSMAAAFSSVGMAGMLPVVGKVILAITAAAFVVNKIAQSMNGATRAAEEYKTAISNISSMENENEQISQSLDNIKSRLEEIKRIREEDEPDTEELENLEKEERALGLKSEQLERELRIKEQLLEIERAEAAVAIEKAMTDTFKSEITPGAQVKLPDELGAATQEYTKYTEAIKKSQEAIEELSKEVDENGRVTKSAQKKIDEYNKSIDHFEKKQQNAGKVITNLTKSLMEYQEGLEGVEGYEELSKYIENLVNASNDYMDINMSSHLLDEADAVEEVTMGYEGLRDAILDKAEVEDISLEQMDDILNEYNLIAKAMKEVETQGYLNMDTYDALIAMSEDFRDVLGLEEDQIWDLLGASKEKRKERIQASIDEQRQIIASAEQEIEAYKQTMAVMMMAASAQKAYIGIDSTVSTEKANQIRANIENAEKIISDAERKISRLKQVEVVMTKSDSNTRKEREKRKTGGGRGSSKKQKEAYQAEIDLYAQINALLSKNNALISMNQARRELMIKGSKVYTDSLTKETDLLKKRQTLLNENNEIMRAEARELQKSLSGIFNFEGSWNDNSMMITNMKNIGGQSKEVEEQFKRLQKIMEELPKASLEWHKINKELNNIKIDEMNMKFDNFYSRLDSVKENLENIDLNLRIEGADKEENQLNSLILKVTEYDVAVKDTELALKKLANMGFEPGTQAAEEHSKRLKQLQADNKEYKALLVETKAAIQEKAEAQKQAIREQWAEEKNAKLQKQRDEIAAIQQVQDAIVEIIRKRGEEEMRILDEAHKAEMDRLQKEYDARKKANQKELDDYKKLIMDKIAALDAANAEEDYREQLLKEQEEASRLQKEIDILSLDDSLTAKNKKAELRKQLAAQIEKIEKMQQKRSRDAMKQALLDELKDYENQNKDKNDIEDDSFNKTKKQLQEEYELKKKKLEEEYTNAKIYAEAAEALMTGQVEVAEGVFKDIATAHRDFQREFGEGMGLLGDIIQDEFVRPLEMAEEALHRLERIDLSKAPRRDNYTSSDYDDSRLEEDGYKPPKKPDTSYESRNMPPDFYSPTWDPRDYNEYVNNKRRWEKATNSYEKEQINQRNRQLRMKYWGKSGADRDNYSLDELERYKDGGVMDKTGLFIGHGSEQSSEVVFSAKTAKKLWDYVERIPDFSKFSFKAPMANYSQPNVNIQSGDTHITFEVEGSMDKSILPEVERIVNSAINKAEFQKRKELNKIGKFRLV